MTNIINEDHRLFEARVAINRRAWYELESTTDVVMLRSHIQEQRRALEHILHYLETNQLLAMAERIER